MRKHGFWCGLIVLAAALTSTAFSPTQAPIRNDNLLINLGDVRTGMCSPTMDGPGMITAMTPLSALLLNHNRGGQGTAPASCGPLLAPDGHQLTLGEYMAASGRAAVKCINAGTHSVLHFKDLIPNGTYSGWLVLPNPMPPPRLIGGSTLGPVEPANFFTASEAGEGQLSVITPAKNLSIFGGPIGPCFLDQPVELHLAYHADGETHGDVPGPLPTWVVQARFLFP
ncbi:MAG TPA: hypothetical protein VIF64_11220 [Pyrinomonadaceae bacterium]